MALLAELARYCLRTLQLSLSRSLLSFPLFHPLSLSPLYRSIFLRLDFLSSFLTFIFFFLFVTRTHARVSLTDEVQRTRERGACAGLHDCRNCRYAAKVEGVQRQPCARLLSVFLSVFFPPPFSFFFLSTPSSSPFFSCLLLFSQESNGTFIQRQNIKKRSRAKKNSHPYATDTRVIVSSLSQCLSHEFFASALTYRRNTETRSCYHGFNIRRFADVRVECDVKI